MLFKMKDAFTELASCNDANFMKINPLDKGILIKVKDIGDYQILSDPEDQSVTLFSPKSGAFK